MDLKYEFDGNDFEYSVDFADLRKAFIDILLQRTKQPKTPESSKLVDLIVEDLDLICKNEILEDYEDDLLKYFYEDAYILYQEQEQDEADKKTWYGTKNDIWRI